MIMVENRSRRACGYLRRLLKLASPGSASNRCDDVTFSVNSCPCFNSIDASKLDGNAAVFPIDLPPTDSAKARPADSYSRLSLTGILLNQEDSKKRDVVDEEQYNKMIHDTNTCYPTNSAEQICIEEHETQERDVLHEEREQPDSGNSHGGYQFTPSSQKSAQVHSGMSEQSGCGAFLDCRFFQ